MPEATQDATEVTFEDGYEQLKEIVKRLDDADVSVHETGELFGRGKSLEKELRTYLETQQGKLTKIEAGQDLPKFRIVAPEEPSGSTDDEVWDDEPELPAPGDVPSHGSRFTPAPAASDSSEDDIPF